jgi:thymidylate synthase
MHVITGTSFEEVYKQTIYDIFNFGADVSPRGTKTLEIAPATLVIEDARKFLTMPNARKGNYTFQLAEFLWMMRGSNDLEEIAHYNSVWRYFEDEDEPGILNGAYGERLRAWNDSVDQFLEVYEKLKKDPYSRQAVMVIFDPDRDNMLHEDGKYSKDIPCTNYFNFQIRDGKLNMWTVMRSNDLHKGSIYDIPNFILMQHVLAGWLNVEVGKYTHSAASLHMYESDIKNFVEIFNTKDDTVVYDKEYSDPRMDMKEFNDTMMAISVVESYSRLTETVEVFEASVEKFISIILQIKNDFWKSVAAQIVMYNYRKLGATEEQFKVFLPFITNEYRKNCETWKAIKK